ncbi:MAG: winged helix-turn-helix transcriptional regulator [Thermoplasmatota archaeon]
MRTENATRSRLLELVQRASGISFGEAARILNVDPSTVAYHARVLAKQHAVTLQPRARGQPQGIIARPREVA